MSPLRSGPMKRTAKFFFVFLRWIDRRGVERHAGSALVSGVGFGKRVARGSRVGARLETTRGGEGARAETGGRDGRGDVRPVLAFRRFRWASFRAKKGHVASFAPFATNVLSSGGVRWRRPRENVRGEFHFLGASGSLEGSTTAVATVRASSRCRFARPDEKRAGVLIPESARARLRGSPRCGARARARGSRRGREWYMRAWRSSSGGGDGSNVVRRLMARDRWKHAGVVWRSRAFSTSGIFCEDRHMGKQSANSCLIETHRFLRKRTRSLRNFSTWARPVDRGESLPRISTSFPEKIRERPVSEARDAIQLTVHGPEAPTTDPTCVSLRRVPLRRPRRSRRPVRRGRGPARPESSRGTRPHHGRVERFNRGPQAGAW